MSVPSLIGVVSMSTEITTADLLPVIASIQKQVTRDFGPIWNVQASISVFNKLEEVPLGYWRVMIVDDDDQIPPGANGIHLDKHHQPFALILARVGWGLSLSHEILEMLADPFGNLLVAGQSLMAGQGRVLYLAEVCDPCESPECGYWVDGFLMSDFYTPNYFNPVASAGVTYSFKGSITSPRQVLPGGYLSWLEPSSNDWYQAQFFDDQIEFVNLGKMDIEGSIRATIDRKTNPRADKALLQALSKQEPASAKKRRPSLRLTNPNAAVCRARSECLMEQVDSILNRKEPYSKSPARQTRKGNK